jgi:DNA-binding NtrC family response regulator
MSSLNPGTRIFADQRPALAVRALRLEVKRGPDKGKVTELAMEPVRIGTASGCDFQLTDDTVSGFHTEISRTSMGLLVRDLGSTNGTFLDGHRIHAAYLDAQGQRGTLDLGGSRLRVTVLAQENALEVTGDDRCGELIGRSLLMRSLFARLNKLTHSDVTVLLTGETGTGKELAAAALHELGPRRDQPLVVIDCGALPANLTESEMLGHERGAFTGADRARPGAFERAHGGTLFLDEIGELSLALQPVLLGVIERREVRRLGASQTHGVDVRVIAATNRDLAQEMRRGAFRADLYYRLAVAEVRLPALREHVEDIPVLIEQFLAELPGEKPSLSEETIAEMQRYPWPGNVRELRNVIERAALLAEEPRSPATSIDASEAGQASPSPGDTMTRPFKDLKQEVVAKFEAEYVAQLLMRSHGNVAAAARLARIDRMYLYKLMEKHGLAR